MKAVDNPQCSELIARGISHSTARQKTSNKKEREITESGKRNAITKRCDIKRLATRCRKTIRLDLYQFGWLIATHGVNLETYWYTWEGIRCRLFFERVFYLTEKLLMFYLISKLYRDVFLNCHTFARSIYYEKLKYVLYFQLNDWDTIYYTL